MAAVPVLLRQLMRSKKFRNAVAGGAAALTGYFATKKSPAPAKKKAVKRSMRFNKDLATTTEAKATGKMAEFNRKMREGLKKRGIKVNKKGRASLR